MDAYLQTFLQQFQHLKIQLEKIISATDNFNDEKNCIGVGGFGKVYKGQVSDSNGRSMAAIKRLDPRHGQGTPEFLKEIMTLSRYTHQNIISLLGFCCEGREMILVYEYASRGSLDRHLNSPRLTWSQRLKICLDVAKGLCYLHDPRETHQRLIHCDVKSSNILLDEQWNAKVSDFGLSIMGPANEQQSVIVTLAVGTHGYCDPQYGMTHTLTKESDVYSFGVVLYEVLCGRLCCTYSNGCVQKILVPTWIESYKQKKLNDSIFKNPTVQTLGESSLQTLSDIAYRCLKESREDRPKMAEVVTELEYALESQELSEGKLLFDYRKMAKTAEPPLKYRSNDELRKLLIKGVLLNGGKTWFSLNEEGEHYEMISFVECLDLAPRNSSAYNSRFTTGPYKYNNRSLMIKTRVKTQFLSPGIIYTVNFVFKIYGLSKFESKLNEAILLEYKLLGETQPSISYLADKREDGWWMCELYQFTCDHRCVDLEIMFSGFSPEYDSIGVEGIEFRPLEKVEHKDEIQYVSDSDANWEEKLPTDYGVIMKLPKDSVPWATKKEAYLVMRKGFLIDDGQTWFSLDTNGKKCYMLSTRAARVWGSNMKRFSFPESRFGEAVDLLHWEFGINTKINAQLVSSPIRYASYLVYKLTKDESKFKSPVEIKDWYSHCIQYIYLVSPQTPVIEPKDRQNTHNLVNRLKVKALPQQRNDGWMEVQIWESQIATTTKINYIDLKFTVCYVESFKGLIVDGIEFRPV